MKFFYYFILIIIILILFTTYLPHYINYRLLDKYGVIKIDDFKEVFVKAKDNDYYLNHDLQGNYDIKGSIFLDYRVNIFDKILIFYGHNSQTLDVPFKYLENYYDENFYNNHQIIEVFDKNVYLKYQIFSVFITTSDFFYMNLDLNYDEYLTKIQEYSWYKSNVTLKEDDDLIILQTCSYKEEYKNHQKKYLIIVGKKIEI